MPRLAALVSRLRSTFLPSKSEICNLKSAIRASSRRLFLEPLESRLALAAISWDGGGGDLDWNNASNWSSDALPVASDDVTISVPGDVIIIHPVGATEISSLTSEESINWSGGSLSLTASSAVSGQFHNSGSVHVIGGTLALASGGTSSGSFSVSAGGSLAFGGPHVLGASSIVSGDGEVHFGNGSSTVAGLYSVAGSTDIGVASCCPSSLAMVNFSGDVHDMGSLSARNAVVDFHANSFSTTDLTLSGSGGDVVVKGMNNLAVTGSFDWAGGTLMGPGTVSIQAGGMMNLRTVIDGGTQLYSHLDGATLINAGSAWTSGVNGGALIARNGAVIDNTGVFNIQTDWNVGFDGVGAAPTFNNSGLLKNTNNVWPGTQIGSGFNNSGTVEAVSGNLGFSSFTQTSGTTALIGGTISGTLNIQGGSVEGSGSIFGAVNSAGQVSPGLSPGVILVNGNYSQVSGGALMIQLAGSTPGTLPSNHDQLDVHGEIALVGALNVSLINGFSPSVGDVFTIVQNDASDAINGTFDGLPEASELTIADSSKFRISYVGGDGNDVTLTCTYRPPQVRTVVVDIQAESLNVDSNKTLTVVIFGAADFNAANIDVSSVHFAGATAWQNTLADANHDGFLDLQLKFRTQDTILDEIYADLLVEDYEEGGLDSTTQTAQVELTGQTLDDALFSGAGSINLFLAGRSLRNLLDTLFG